MFRASHVHSGDVCENSPSTKFSVQILLCEIAAIVIRERRFNCRVHVCVSLSVLVSMNSFSKP